MIEPIMYFGIGFLVAALSDSSSFLSSTAALSG